MPIQIKANIRQSTVKLIGKIIFPLVETGVVTLAEYNEIMANLRYLAKKGTLVPDVLPKLLKTKEVADILGISSSQFRQLEQRASAASIPLTNIVQAVGLPCQSASLRALYSSIKALSSVLSPRFTRAATAASRAALSASILL